MGPPTVSACRASSAHIFTAHSRAGSVCRRSSGLRRQTDLKRESYERLADWFERHARNLDRLGSGVDQWTEGNCSVMNWESLLSRPSFDLRRSGRFLVAALAEPHVVLSTSARNGGLVEHVRWLVNHQSCEGTAHLDRHKVITDVGMEGYHDVVCAEIELPPAESAVMGTAANMNYVAIVTAADGDIEVTAAVTAGVEGNATTAGEPATWRETESGHAEGAGLCRHDQHDSVDQSSADGAGAGARGRDDDRRARAPRCSGSPFRASFTSISPPAQAPTSTASPRPSPGR